MSEPATAVTREARTDDAEQLLLIPAGGAATTVYISIWADGTTLKPQFGLYEMGPWYRDGITWKQDLEYGLLLNFMFEFSQLGSILGISTDPPVPGFWFSKAQVPAPRNGFNQQVCTQNVAMEYPFKVSIRSSSGTVFHIDPKIVVTPQTL